MKNLILTAYAVLVTVLLVLDIGRQIWRHRRLPSEAPPFNLIHVYTNGTWATGIIDTRTRQPVRIEWSLKKDGKTDCISYFFEGKSILELHLFPGRPPGRWETFYDRAGNEKIVWIDHLGTGQFSERILCDSGTVEVWYQDRWQSTDLRNKVRGIVLDGKWCPLILTNGLWSIERPAE